MNYYDLLSIRRRNGARRRMPKASLAKAAGFQVGLIRVEDYFKGTPITAYAGPPPDGQTEYCWGGCPGARVPFAATPRCRDPMPPSIFAAGSEAP